MKRLQTGLIFAAAAGLLGLVALEYLGGGAMPPAAEHPIIDLAERLDQRIDRVSDRVQERVIDLPEDGGLWYLTLVYSDADGKRDPTSRRLKTNFTTNPRLESLITQTTFHKVYPGHSTYEHRTKKHFGLSDGTAAVILQQPDGTVCYKATGANIPADGELLADSIAAAIADCRPRPRPEPTPQPVPDQPPSIPDTVAPEETPSREENLAAVLILAAIAGAGGAFVAYRQEQ